VVKDNNDGAEILVRLRKYVNSCSKKVASVRGRSCKKVKTVMDDDSDIDNTDVKMF